MLRRFLSYVLCGRTQFCAGKRLRGVLLFISFPSCVALAVRYFSLAYGPDASYEGLIGIVSVLLAVLIWSYHVLDIREFGREEKDTDPEGAVAARDARTAQNSKSRHGAGKQANVLTDELYTRGRIAYLRGSWSEAKDCFEKLLRDDRADSDAAFQLGRVYRQLGDARQSERFFRQCQQSPGGGKWAEEIKKYLLENKS